MLSVRSVGLVLAVLMVASSAMGQKPRTGIRRPPIVSQNVSAVAIIQQSLSIQGLPSSPTLETIATGTFTDSNGQVNSLTIETAGEDRLRFNIGADFSYVTNGGNGFVIMQGVRHILPGWTAKYRRPEHLPSLSLIADYQNSNLQLQYVGLENVNGSLAHHLSLSMLPSDGTPSDMEAVISESHVWIDATSSLVVQTRTFDFSPETPENRTPVDTYLGNYRPQGGALIPFHVTSYVSGQQYSDMVLTSINLSATIPDSDFQ
jgi:hypothetical protein